GERRVTRVDGPRVQGTTGDVGSGASAPGGKERHGRALGEISWFCGSWRLDWLGFAREARRGKGEARGLTDLSAGGGGSCWKSTPRHAELRHRRRVTREP